ncbi:MAG: argininosuccinate lyase [Clostridia bacterium]|nr:argininosuccinate lyase [Clostridia bacterium]
MGKMWAGRFKKQLDKHADDFNSSIHIDSIMYKEDIAGSIAHATMLAAQGIIDKSDAEVIINGLTGILEDIQAGLLQFNLDAEDIHMFIESELTERCGDAGKKLHTARSRNDQVAVDTKMYIRAKIKELKTSISGFIETIVNLAEDNTSTIMSGYTHLQKAQPITFAHHLLAYANMLTRDIGRLDDTAKRMNLSPLGCCALAGTTYPIDREMTAKLLGFDGVTANSLDGVSDRDYCIELASTISILMMHLSRFAEEIILWCSWEFKYIELDDAYSTGSSIMPQKKNPDIAELVRGKTGRVYGNLIALLTIMKGLPLAYNKDMQEDKEEIFDSIDTAIHCVEIFNPMLKTAKILKENMAFSAEKGFINATDCADYLVKKGLPFRTAYKTTGEIVAYCIENKKTLSTLSLEKYKGFSPLFEKDIYTAVDLLECVERRTSLGAPSAAATLLQLAAIKEYLEQLNNG